jgi:hypothetical protein
MDERLRFVARLLEGDKMATRYPARALRPIRANLSRPARTRVPVPRSHPHRHALRAHLLRQPQDQPEHGLRGQMTGVKLVADQVRSMHHEPGFFERLRKCHVRSGPGIEEPGTRPGSPKFAPYLSSGNFLPVK